MRNSFKVAYNNLPITLGNYKVKLKKNADNFTKVVNYKFNLQNIECRNPYDHRKES